MWFIVHTDAVCAPGEIDAFLFDDLH